MSASASQPAELRLRIDRSIIRAADKAAVTSAIAAANLRARSAGLPDWFNPSLVDPAKAEALLTALSSPSGEAVAPLAGRALWLDPTALRIGTSSPTTVASFSGPIKLEVTHDHGETVSARAAVPVDCALARERAAEARRLTEQADRDYQAATGDAIMPARLRRQALSWVWFDNASAYAVCVPNDAAAATDRDAADHMAKASVVIGGSME
jgi:hypothetical protein